LTTNRRFGEVGHKAELLKDLERQFANGGGVGFKTEHRHRGMKLGIAPHSPDYWGRQLAVGGDEEN